MPASRARQRVNPNWLRWLGRDVPRMYELAMRVREKSRIVADDLLSRAAPAMATATMDPATLAAELRALGVRPGDALMVHSSWESARVLAASPVELVDTVREVLGPDGTLCMPAYPQVSATDCAPVFDIHRSPSRAGLLSEVFRRSPGVIRSAQLRSVAAAGSLGTELTREHHLSPYPSGTLSPYAKLAGVGGKVLCIGVGAEYNTLFHCAEDILKDDFPVSLYEDGLLTIQVRMADGTTKSVTAYERAARWGYCADSARLLPYFEDLLERRTICGVEASLVPADAFLDRLLLLARDGIHMYGFRFPSPRSVLK